MRPGFAAITFGIAAIMALTDATNPAGVGLSGRRVRFLSTDPMISSTTRVEGRPSVSMTQQSLLVTEAGRTHSCMYQ